MYYIADKETGNKIEAVNTIEQGKKLIEQYEASDKEDGMYEYYSYCVIDEDGIRVD